LLDESASCLRVFAVLKRIELSITVERLNTADSNVLN
jgi:hypothetical protein